MSSCPKLRIEGFTVAWEQRKVGELIKSHNAGIYISKDRYGEGTNIIGVSNIYDSDIFNGEIYRLGPVDDESFLLEEGDLVYGESSLVPEGIARTICVGKNGAGSAFAWHTRRIKLNQEIVNSHFATLELNYHPVVRKHLIRVATQTALTGMTTDGYFSAPLFMPSVKEQEKISNFFICLDNLITLHQRKSDALKNAKKYFLKNMFPSEGEKFPKLRLEGFTDAWEQRKLGDIAPLRGGFAFKSNEYCSAGVPIVRISNILSDGSVGADFAYYDEQDYDETYTLYDGAAVLAMSGATTGKVSVLQAERGKKYYQNQRVGYFMPTENCDYGFIRTIVKSQLFTDQLSSVLVAGAQPNVSSKDIDAFEFMIPKSKEEQRTIGLCFENIDNLITLHQRKCDALKNAKKFFLQNMFV